MKTKTVIGFKADAETLKNFNGYLANLEVDKTELAELAHKRGVALAARELREKKVRKARQQLAKLSALLPQALHVLRIRQGCAAGVL